MKKTVLSLAVVSAMAAMPAVAEQELQPQMDVETISSQAGIDTTGGIFPFLLLLILLMLASGSNSSHTNSVG